PAFAAAIGIGINCAHHPQGTPYPASDLAAAGVPVTPDRLLGALAASMQTRLEQWQRGDGFSAIREAWLPRAAGLGEAIKVRLPERELTGRFEGVDEAGRLLLQTTDAMLPITAGEVFG